jgi:pimeloyl-ACP methyl ester carboxylesterase
MRRATVRDGTEIAYFAEAAAPGTPTFVFAHATGFCAAVWEPVLAGVRREMPNAGLVVVDQRAHGSSGASPHPFDWWDVGRDAIDVVATEGVDGPLVGVGHSAGGAGLLLAEILHPGSLAGIVAIEPIVPPPPYERRDPPIARNAARRRSWFPSRDSVRERFVARPPFSQWDPAAFDGYLAHGFSEGTDPETGKPGVVLACTVVVLAGSESMTHAEGPPEEIAARLGNVRLHMVERASHFIPMELPGLVVDEAVGLAASLSR